MRPRPGDSFKRITFEQGQQMMKIQQKWESILANKPTSCVTDDYNHIINKYKQIKSALKMEYTN